MIQFRASFGHCQNPARYSKMPAENKVPVMLDRIHRPRIWRLMPSYVPIKPGCYTISFVPDDLAEKTLRFTFAGDETGRFGLYEEPPAFVRMYARPIPEENIATWR